MTEENHLHGGEDDFDDVLDRDYVKVPKMAQITVYGILIAITVTGNLIVIFLMLNRGTINVAKLYLLSICICNVLVGPLMISLELYHLLYFESIGETGCKCIVYFETVSFTANMYMIVLFVGDMYRTILSNARRSYSRFKVALAITAVWFGSCIFALKSFISIDSADFDMETRQSVNSNTTANLSASLQNESTEIFSDIPDEHIICSYLMEESEGDLIGRYIDLVVNLFIPQVVCMICLLRLKQKLWQQQQGINTTLRRRRKLVKLLMGLLVFNVTCWIPIILSDVIVDTASLFMTSEKAEELESSHVFNIAKYSFAVCAFCSSSASPVVIAWLDGGCMGNMSGDCCKSCCQFRVFPLQYELPDLRETVFIINRIQRHTYPVEPRDRSIRSNPQSTCHSNCEQV